MPEQRQTQSDVSVQTLQEEITRLNKVILALMNRAERNASLRGSDFNLFQTAITLEDQVRHRTQELEAAMRENEKITRALRESADQIRQLAYYDTLTQLANRRQLTTCLERAMAVSKRSGRYGAVMFLDLDNFKPLNDQCGHDAGDMLLIEAAHRLNNCVREVDTIARIGGDEFVVLIGELDQDKEQSIAHATIVAEKVRAALAAPYRLTRKCNNEEDAAVVHHSTASIGVVLFNDNEANQEDILKWADMAMYQAKEAGRNRVVFFDGMS